MGPGPWRTVPCVTVGLFACCGWGWAPVHARTERPPNILLIVADDLGVEGLSTYGGIAYDTPSIDALAESGRVYGQAYSQPKCSPSRAQLLTGQYNARNYRAFGYLDARETTVAEVLQDAGYATAIAGKWQLSAPTSGAPIPVPAGPLAPHVGPDDMRDGYGFDAYSLWQLNDPLCDSSYWRLRDVGGNSRYWWPVIEQDGVHPATDSTDYGPDLHAAYLTDFMTRHADQPFFALYSAILPHDPWVATPEGPDGPATQAARFGFGANVSYLDSVVGRLVGKLDELGIREQTLVIFTSDNGSPTSALTRTVDGWVQGGKGSLTDAGTHVPLIANWPGRIRPGEISAQLIDFTDFLPTISEVTATAIPDGLVVDGRPFLEADGSPALDGRTAVYVGVVEDGREGRDAGAFARDGRYKLYDDGRFFDVTMTPLEGPEDHILEEEGSEEANLIRTALQAVLDEHAPSGHRPVEDMIMRTQYVANMWDADGDGRADGAGVGKLTAGRDAQTGTETRFLFEFPIDRSQRAQLSVGRADQIVLQIPVTAVEGEPGPLRVVALAEGEDGRLEDSDFEARGATVAVLSDLAAGDLIEVDVTAHVLADFPCLRGTDCLREGTGWSAFRVEPADAASFTDDPAGSAGGPPGRVHFGGPVGAGEGAENDIRLLLRSLLPGDLDRDGFVGQSDLVLLINRWGQRVFWGNKALGDFNGDSRVGQADLEIVVRDWNRRAPGAAARPPEPSGLAVWGAAVAGLLLRRCRSARHGGRGGAAPRSRGRLTHRQWRGRW